MDQRIATFVMIALGVCLALAACADGSGTASVSPSAQPTEAAATVSPAPTADSPATPPEATRTSAPVTAFEPDEVVVAVADRLRVRSEPGLSSEPLGTLPADAVSLVVDGPVTADGFEWYLLSGLGLPYGSGCAVGPNPTDPFDCPVWLGWVARADAEGAPWLQAVEPDCADPAGPLVEFTFQPRYLYIACYGSEPITLRGWLLVTTGMPHEDPCPQVPSELRRIGCVGPMFQLVDSPESTGPGLIMTLGPDGSLPGDWVEIQVRGHYDDPAAADCTFGPEPIRSVLDCRSVFVVESGTIHNN